MLGALEPAGVILANCKKSAETKGGRAAGGRRAVGEPAPLKPLSDTITMAPRVRRLSRPKS